MQDIVTGDAATALANQLAQSAMLPPHLRGKPADLLWAIKMAETLGVPPMTAVVGIHSINGKPVCSADLMAAVVRRAGHRLRITSTDRECIAVVIRADDPDFPFESRFTWARAEQAKLTGKDTWRQYPAAMLRARAIAEVCRMACPEALLGVYTPDELGAIEPLPPAGKAATLAARQLPPPAQPAPASAPQTVTTANDGPAPESPATAPTPAPQQAVEKVGWLDDSERKWFMAELDHLSLGYEDLAAWRESIGRPRPSGLTSTQRKTLLASLQNPKSVPALALLAWLDARRQSQPDPDPEPEVPAEDDDIGEGFEVPHAIR